MFTLNSYQIKKNNQPSLQKCKHISISWWAVTKTEDLHNISFVKRDEIWAQVTYFPKILLCLLQVSYESSDTDRIFIIHVSAN